MGRRVFKGTVVVTSLSLAFVVLLLYVPLPVQILAPPQAYCFYDRSDRLVDGLLSSDGYLRMHVPLERISPLLIKTLLLEEDRYFYQHYGVNPLAISRALLNNIAAGRVVSGASTITMQLARMLERRERTLWSKCIEAFRAIQLEIRYSKGEILTFYLARAPYGGNIEGVQAAAYAYFGKPASVLSPGEIALLIALPRSPNRLRPDRHPDAAKAARDRILKNMLEGRLIDEDQYHRARREPIPRERIPLQHLIAHTAWHYRLKDPGRYEWRTTIDENIQRRTETLLRHYLKTLQAYNISNAAAVVMDTRTREVRALVGSLDYFDTAALGANDGARTARSPGSTLKPFLYGLAFQKGLISERTILYDIPVNYAGYAPRNYSREFIGPVTAHEALTDSLNVVAVKLSNELGIEVLHHLLKQGGISTLDKPASYYGLPLVLGGVEVNLLELTNLYASLASGGVYQPYRLLHDDPKTPQTRILSAEASWLVTHILTDVERPDFPESWQFGRHRPTIAWKTGTSYGHQDAWSIGYTPRYTIGVWVGNFDASPSTGLAGSKTAAPILFDLFQAIDEGIGESWFAKPANVQNRKVCAVCGRLPNDACQSLVDEYYIKGVEGPANQAICDIPQYIAIDKRNGLQAISATPAKFVEQRVYDIWPSEMAAFLLKHGVPTRRPPPYVPDAMAGQKYYAPKILSPVNNTVYYKRLDRFRNEDLGIKLSAAVTNRVRKVFWFLDDHLLAATDQLKDIIINPDPGSYTLTLMDDTGGTDSVSLVVKDQRELNEDDR